MDYYLNKSLHDLYEIVDGEIRVEAWKPISDYESLYLISDFGRVKALEKFSNGANGSIRYRPENIHYQRLNPKGYPYVNLSVNGKQRSFTVHRLVCTYFVDNPFNLPVINHKKGVKVDNRSWQLEWCTYSYNTKHAFDNGLMIGMVGDKNPMYGKTEGLCVNSKAVGRFSKTGKLIRRYESIKEAAIKTGVDRWAVGKLAKSEAPTARGSYFKFL